MTKKERKELEDKIRLMKGNRYLYQNADVVTVTFISFDKDIVTIDTDCWMDQFDITSFAEWSNDFVPTRKKNQTIDRYQAEISDLRNEIDRIEANAAITEMDLEARNKQVASLEAEIVKQKQTIDDMFREHELQKTALKNLAMEEKPAAKTESVFPELFKILIGTAGDVHDGNIPIPQSEEIRAICKTVAEIAETQNRNIMATKTGFQKPVFKKIDIKKDFKRRDNNNYDNNNND